MKEIEKLQQIMADLRDPERGCPWDVAQNFESIAPYTIEEAYEVADAIERGDPGELRSELGDLLFQVVFHARLAEEQGLFDLAGVAAAIGEKLVRRHPHVFGDASAGDPDSAKRQWEDIKAAERAAHHGGTEPAGALDGIPANLPSLALAQKLGERAARVGFDWPDEGGVRAKIDEELDELDVEREAGRESRVEAEIGDILFTIVNLCRHRHTSAEAVLRRACRRFERRFRSLEAASRAAGSEPGDLPAAELERLWAAAKEAHSA